MSTRHNAAPMGQILGLVEDSLWYCHNTIFEPQTFGPGAKNGYLPKPGDLRKSFLEHDYSAACNICASVRNWRGNWVDILPDCLSRFVADLGDWYFHSKRTYSVSEHMADLLLNTELPDFPAEEIRFVSNSFAIKLEVPIVLPNTEEPCDLVMMSYDPKTCGLSVHAYPSRISEYVSLTGAEKQKFLKKKKRFDKSLMDQVEAFLMELPSYAAPRGFIIPQPKPGETYSQIIDQVESDEGSRECAKLLFRLAVGLNLFLQTKKAQNMSQEISRVPKKTTERGRDIMSDTELFVMNTSYHVPVYKGDARPGSTGESGRTVGPHFRSGHWRRPKGQGHNLEAEKTEWVLPFWIHWEKIMAGEKPVGLKRFVRFGWHEEGSDVAA